MLQGLQQPGASPQQLLKAHALKQDIFFLKAEQAEKCWENPACGGCSGWDREGKEQGAEHVPLITPGAAEQAEKPTQKIISSWELHSSQLIFSVPRVLPSTFKARFRGFQKFAGWREKPAH